MTSSEISRRQTTAQRRAEREARLADALRANLRRRKAQAKDRETDSAGDEAQPFETQPAAAPQNEQK